MKVYSEKIKTAKSVIIYGAGIMAKALFACIKDDVKIDHFMISDKACAGGEINGISVLDVYEGKKYRETSLILVAVTDKYCREIADLLEREGYRNILFVTFESRLWECIREEYLKSVYDRDGKCYQRIEDVIDMASGGDGPLISIYQVRCHLDHKISNITKYSWEIPIQAGAALTNRYVAEIKDNTNDNISNKNREYCELTALYWIWKNDRSKWKGICHYRRHFELEAEVIKDIENSDIDVILPVPILNFPDVRFMYCHDHVEDDWDIMMEAIKELHPQYSKTAKQLQKGQFYYGYNMLIARADIFDKYCTWLFPVLEYCEKRCEKKEDNYQNRYIGFLAERLLSIFFLYHWEDYKIVHCSKTFLNSGDS